MANSPEYYREYRRKNLLKIRARERVYRISNPLRARAKDLWERYRITLEEFSSMFKSQEGKCAICKDSEAKQVDHNHKTGKVRGLLCQRCNCALGLLDDSTSRIASALEYKKSRDE